MGYHNWKSCSLISVEAASNCHQHYEPGLTEVVLEPSYSDLDQSSVLCVTHQVSHDAA